MLLNIEKSSIFLVKHFLKWEDLKWMDSRPQPQPASLAGSQSAWPTCVPISYSPDDAVMLSGLKIHVLTKASSVLLVKSNPACSLRLNAKIRTKSESCQKFLLVSFMLCISGFQKKTSHLLWISGKCLYFCACLKTVNFSEQDSKGFLFARGTIKQTNLKLSVAFICYLYNLWQNANFFFFLVARLT